MTNREYWEKRAEERKNAVTRMAEEAAEKARETYERSKHQINKEVAYWIQQFADAEGISYEEARKMLTDGEWEQYRMTLEEYIRRGEQLGVHPEWEAAMVKASALHHIDRLTALKTIIRAEMEEAKTKLQDTDWMHNIADYSFQYTLFTIETDQEVAIQFRLPDLETMHQTIEQAWAPDGMNFKQRQGINNDKLAAEVERLLTQACVTGESYEELAKQLTDQFDLKEYEAERIIRTEATQIATRSEMAAYQAAGIDEYEFLATLDEKTCKICGPMDRQVFPVAEAEPGITAPPLHPNCRCTTIGHYEDDLIDETRIARDENGDPIHVDGGMSWDEWKDQYNVFQGSDAEMTALSRMYINSEDKLKERLEKVKPYKDFEDFGFHGDAGRLFYYLRDGKEMSYTAREFADMLRADPEYHGGKIRLLACNAGAGENCFAEQLAKEMGVVVRAPSEALFVDDEGNLFITDSDILADMWYNRLDVKETGEWREFSP